MYYSAGHTKLPLTPHEKFKYIQSRPNYVSILGAMDLYVYVEAKELDFATIYLAEFEQTVYFRDFKDAERMLQHFMRLFGKKYEGRCIMWGKSLNWCDCITFTIYPNEDVFASPF